MENSKKSYILSIYSAQNTVFTVKDIALIWDETNMELVRRRLYRYAKAGKLYAIRKGLYAKNKNYNKSELATKVFTPSYISFETVLAKAGVVFQFYNQIFVASYLTREIIADGQKFSYKKIKDSVLTNRAGVETKENYHSASPERAFLDIVYSRKGYHFDNLSPLDWEKIFRILPIYKNKAMEQRVERYHKSVSAEGESASGENKTT